MRHRERYLEKIRPFVDDTGLIKVVTSASWRSLRFAGQVPKAGFSCHLDKDCFYDHHGNAVGFHSRGYLLSSSIILRAQGDAMADKLFPGTSTLLTKARYFFLVPYLSRFLEEGHDSSRQDPRALREQFRGLERNCAVGLRNCERARGNSDEGADHVNESAAGGALETSLAALKAGCCHIEMAPQISSQGSESVRVS